MEKHFPPSRYVHGRKEMESTLHQQLKEHYATCGQTEVALGDYRIDAIRDHQLIEVQCASLSAIRKKCKVLLEHHSLCVVKPITFRTRIARAKKAGGPVISKRLSPKRGSLLELFEEMIYFIGIFPHPNLTLEVPLVNVVQKRIPRKKNSRWWQKDYRVEDVTLESFETSIQLQTADDLLKTVQLPDNLDCFDTSKLAQILDRPRCFAQQVAYVLRKTGAIQQVTRKREGIIYRRAA